MSVIDSEQIDKSEVKCDRKHGFFLIQYRDLSKDEDMRIKL